MKLKKLLWAIVLDILLIVALIIYIVTPEGTTSAGVYMTPAEASLTRGAISLVLNEIQNGKITTMDIALNALRSELPINVQDEIIKQLQDSTFSTLSDDLVDLAGNIKIKE